MEVLPGHLSPTALNHLPWPPGAPGEHAGDSEQNLIELSIRGNDSLASATSLP